MSFADATAIGGGGTDKCLRYYLMEASIGARHLARFQPAYERVERRRGRKVGRIVVARMLLRSLYKVLRDGIARTTLNQQETGSRRRMVPRAGLRTLHPDSIRR